MEFILLQWNEGKLKILILVRKIAINNWLFQYNIFFIAKIIIDFCCIFFLPLESTKPLNNLSFPLFLRIAAYDW